MYPAFLLRQTVSFRADFIAKGGFQYPNVTIPARP